jgi:putative nucleotidyltransferase with HDIG domain
MDKRRLELQLRDHQEYLEGKVQEQAREIRQTFLGALQCLALAMEARDPYTAGHSRRVAELATAIGKQMGLVTDQVDELHWGSILHDIGKIAVDQSILDKPGRLTPAEYDHVMTHTTVGASLVGQIAPSKGVVEIIQHHHTPYRSGSGRGAVVDGHVSLLARIVAVADAYDAMTSARPYRPALSNEEAVKEIKLNMGRQFDPVVASTFVSMVNSGMPAKKFTVLVADDEASIRLLVRSALSGKYAVVEAADGDEAVRMARDYKPAVVILDILMPQKDGLQACHEIKSEEMTREIPVVILTGVNHKLNRKLCTELGAASYITKPFSPQRLLEIVDGIVGKGQW